MLTRNIKENYPYISVVTYGGNEYVGIIANQDQHITTMYVFTQLINEDDKRQFLEVGETWWWESNRMIPINIFMREEMERFKHTLIVMNSKDVKVTIGPCVNLNNLTIKRVKRKNVQLLKRPKN